LVARPALSQTSLNRPLPINAEPNALILLLEHSAIAGGVKFILYFTMFKSILVLGAIFVVGTAASPGESFAG
jgi:hypothetical protein